MQTRRRFIQSLLAAGSLIGASSISWSSQSSAKKIIRPPRLEKGDTIGLITPASPLFEAHAALIEATEKMHALGFKVKAGKNIFKHNGFFAGSIEERLEDLHGMFADPQIKAILTIRGGYGSAQLLPHIDYELIRSNPKILCGYSDITSLLNGIHHQTGLVTFHGPVAVSTFTDFTKKYFYKVLMEPTPVGWIDDAPYDENLQSSNRIYTLNPGKASGRLVGGNMTLLQSSMGTPFEFDSDGAILFFEEIGEEPYDIDRMLDQFKQAGKFENCKGVIFDKMPEVQPASYKSAFYRNLSVEEVIGSYLGEYDFPVCVGFSLGHIKNKPTLPIGIMAELDADKKRLGLSEAAVI